MPMPLTGFLPPGAVHQGAALEACDPLQAAIWTRFWPSPARADRRRIVLVLDQLSDPHNVGAILRTAAAFGVTAVVVQDRHAPPQSGALAKAASGALEIMPYVEVVNIARALDRTWPSAASGASPWPAMAKQTPGARRRPAGDVALVLGSEGDGIRRLVREHCDSSRLHSRSKARWRASTSPMPPRSRCTK